MEPPQKKVLVPIACGSEEMEVVTLIDVFRVAGANVTVASVEARLQVECSSHVKLVADTFIADCAFQIFDLVALPGGMPGSERLRDCKVLQNITEAQAKDGRLYGAISAAPAVVLETWGLLKGLRATCHRQFLDQLSSAIAVDSNIQIDGVVTTSRGPGLALEFALSLAEQLYGREKLEEVLLMFMVAKGWNGCEEGRHEYNVEDWSLEKIPRFLCRRLGGRWPSRMAKRNGKGGKDSHESETETDRSPKIEEDGSPKEAQPDSPADKELCRLQGTIKAQENELAEIRQMLQVLAGAEGQNIREAKILELLRKNRALKVSYERERLRANRFKSQLSLVQEELVKIREEPNSSLVSQNGDKESKEAREWKEKFNQVNSKFLEVQASRAIVAGEVSRLQHALQREVGEHIPISKVLEEGGDWRGRSQQISILKGKIQELKDKLQQASQEEYQHSQFEAFEHARRKEFEKLAIEFLTTREELELTKQKLGGTLARRNILESELKCAKQKMAVLVSKSDNDDRLISALRLELESYKQAEGPVQLGQKIGGPLSLDLVQRQHRLAASFDELKRHCYEQELQIEAQTELIDYLRAITAAQHEKELNETEVDVPKDDTNITKAAVQKDTTNVTEAAVQKNNTKING